MAKSKKATKLVGTLNIMAKTPSDIMKGVVKSVDNGSMLVNCQKKGSNKHYYTSIALNNILFIKTEKKCKNIKSTVGKDVEITLKPTYRDFKIVNVTMTNVVDGMFCGISTSKKVDEFFMVAADNADFKAADPDDVVSKRGRKKDTKKTKDTKKSSKSKSSKKSKKQEVEEIEISAEEILKMRSWNKLEELIENFGLDIDMDDYERSKKDKDTLKQDIVTALDLDEDDDDEDYIDEDEDEDDDDEYGDEDDYDEDDDEDEDDDDDDDEDDDEEYDEDDYEDDDDDDDDEDED